MKIHKVQTLLALIISLSIFSCSDDDSSDLENTIDTAEENITNEIDEATDAVDETTTDITNEIDDATNDIDETATDITSEIDEATDDVDETSTEEEETESNGVLTGSLVGNAPYIVTGEVTVNEERTQLTITGLSTSSRGITLEFYILTRPGSGPLQPDEYISLGDIQGFSGDFTYDIPEGVNFETHPYISLWCVPIDLDFGSTLLQ